MMFGKTVSMTFLTLNLCKISANWFSLNFSEKAQNYVQKLGNLFQHVKDICNFVSHSFDETPRLIWFAVKKITKMQSRLSFFLLK